MNFKKISDFFVNFLIFLLFTKNKGFSLVKTRYLFKISKILFFKECRSEVSSSISNYFLCEKSLASEF